MGALGLSRCPIKLPSGDRPLTQPKAVPCRSSPKDCNWPIAAIVGGALTALPHARVSVARAKDKQSNFRRLFERSARGAQRVPPDQPPARRAFSFPGFFWQDKRNRVAAGRLPASKSNPKAEVKKRGGTRACRWWACLSGLYGLQWSRHVGLGARAAGGLQGSRAPGHQGNPKSWGA